MSEYPPNQPPAAPYSQQQPPPRPGNGAGIASLVLGIIAVAGFAIPFLNYGAIVVAIVGLILGFIGIRAKSRPHRAALAGIILSAIGLVLSIILAVIYTVALAGATKAIQDLPSTVPDTTSQSAAPAASPSSSSAATRSVIYDVTGNGTKATSVSYLTFNDGGSGQSQANGTAIPFHKVVPITDASLFSSSIFSLVAQSADGTSITCKITVDGKVISTNTSTGQYAVATCSGSAG